MKTFTTSRIIFFFCFVIFTSIFKSGFAQRIKTFDQIATEESTIEWLTIKPGLNINVNTFFEEYKEVFGITENNTFKVLKTENDDLGFTHTRFDQYYNGIKIEGAQYILHSKEGRLVKANGNIVRIIRLNTAQSISEQDALKTAYNAIPSKKYAWLDSNELQKWIYEGNKQQDIYPKGELVIRNKKNDLNNSEDFVLAWKFIVRMANYADSRSLYIDANSNQLIYSFSIYPDCIATTGPTSWSGYQQIKTSFNGSKYILHEQCYNHGDIHTVDYGVLWNSEYKSSNNTWSSNNQSGVTAHRYARVALDFYFSYFNRNSFDNAGGALKVNNDDNKNPNGAHWGYPNEIFLGTGSSSGLYDNFNTLDIIGHEIAHGVSDYSGRVGSGWLGFYSGEPGTLNEVFSDIFGTAIERYFKGACCFDWTLGGDRTASAAEKRNMQYPKAWYRHYTNSGCTATQTGQPNTYHGTFWNYGSCDYGGVHINNGVLNYWFYLLSQGGAGTNDNNYSYNFTGIGFNDAIKIAYRTLTVYLYPSGVYGDAKNGSLQSAIDLFGANSNQYNKVKLAWCAVGLGTCTGSCTPPSSPTASSPGSTTAPGTGTTSVNLSWTSISGATGYYPAISQCPYGASNVIWYQNCLSNNSIAVNNLAPGNLYRWNVAASSNCSNVSCTGSYSSQLYFNIPPVISPSGTASICSGGSIILSTTAGNTVQTPTYQWYLNGNAISGATSASYTASVAGNYTVRIIYSCGATDTSQPTTVAVSTLSTPASLSPGSTNQGAPTVITSNSPTLTWNAVNGNAGICYKINITNTSNNQTTSYCLCGANAATISGLITGVLYKWNVQAFSGNSCSSSCSSNVSQDHYFQITTPCTVPPVPTPTFGSNGCPGTPLTNNYQNINLSWNSSGSYSYDIEIREYPFGNNNIVYTQNCISGNSVNVTSTSIVPGKMYSWTIRATTNCTNCNSAVSQPYYFHVVPETSPSGAYGGAYYVCNGSGTTISTAAINVPTPGNVSYQWYYGNPGSAITGATSNTYYATQSGYYYVKLSYSGSNICSGTTSTSQSFSAYISISSNPNPPTLASNSPVCEGNNLSLSASAPTNAIYFWTGPNGFSSNNTSVSIPTVNNSHAGSYYCYVTINGCQSQPAVVNVVVDPAPNASFTYNVASKTATFTNTSTNSTSYNWSFGDLQTSTQTSPTHTYAANNYYNVCLTANKNGCTSSSDCKIITIGSGGPSYKTIPTFTKLFNDTFSNHKYWWCSDICQSTVDSGYIGIGRYQNTVNANNTIQYFKTNKNGNLAWVRNLTENGGASPFQIINADTGFILCFIYNSRPVLMKIDESGNKIWGRQINNNVALNKVKKINGGYLWAGSSGNTVNLIKIDNSGNLIWQKQYMYTPYAYTDISIRDCFQDTYGNFYLFGYIGNSQVSPPTKSWDGIIIKINAGGNHIWSKYYSSATNIQDMVLSAVEDTNKRIVFSGLSRNTSTNIQSGFISKIDTSGTVINSKLFPQQVIASIFVKDSTGSINLLASGSNGDNSRMLKVDTSLGVINQKEFKTKSIYSVKPTYDNRFIACGQYPYNVSNNDYRYNFLKFSLTDTSCIDTTSSNISLSNVSFTLNSISNSSATTTFSSSNFNVNVLTSNLDDTNICQHCNAIATISPSGNQQICAGDSIVLTANSGVIGYLWSNGNTTQSIAVKTPANYFLTVIDSFGCVANSSPVNLTVHPLPYADAGPDQSLCKNDSVIIGTAQIKGSMYKWVPGNSLNDSSNALPIAKPQSTTTYTVTVTDSNNCTSTDQMILNVNVPPIVDAGNNSSIVIGDTVTIGGNPTATGSAPFVYSWTPSAGLNSISTANPIAKPAITTTYYVNITDSNGCMGNDSVVVTVNPVHVMNVVNEKGLHIYPNPNKGQFTILLNNVQIGMIVIEVYTQLGQKILSINEDVANHLYVKDISLSDIPSGIYYVVISTELDVYKAKLILTK